MGNTEVSTKVNLRETMKTVIDSKELMHKNILDFLERYNEIRQEENFTSFPKFGFSIAFDCELIVPHLVVRGLKTYSITHLFDEEWTSYGEGERGEGVYLHFYKYSRDSVLGKIRLFSIVYVPYFILETESKSELKELMTQHEEFVIKEGKERREFVKVDKDSESLSELYFNKELLMANIK